MRLFFNKKGQNNKISLIHLFHCKVTWKNVLPRIARISRNTSGINKRLLTLKAKQNHK